MLTKQNSSNHLVMAMEPNLKILIHSFGQVRKPLRAAVSVMLAQLKAIEHFNQGSIKKSILRNRSTCYQV